MIGRGQDSPTLRHVPIHDANAFDDVLSANRDYVSAEAASLRAIRILGKTLGERDLEGR